MCEIHHTLLDLQLGAFTAIMPSHEAHREAGLRLEKSRSQLPIPPPPSTNNKLTPKECIHHFFDCIPPQGTISPNHTKGDSTRQPMEFDRHLHDKLIMKQVRYLPSMKRSLEAIAGQALVNYPGPLPDVPSKPADIPFPDPDALQTVLGPEEIEFLDETFVEDAYKNFSKFCVVLAATLELQLPEWGKGCISWEKRNSAVTGYTNAFADGYLQTNSAALNSQHKAAMEDTHLILRDLANWEFKSLKAGSLPVMEAIMEHSKGNKSFDWVGCAFGDEECFYRCGKGDSDQDSVNGARMGPDANYPVVNLPDTDGSIWGTPSAKATRAGPKTHAIYILQQVMSFFTIMSFVPASAQRAQHLIFFCCSSGHNLSITMPLLESSIQTTMKSWATGLALIKPCTCQSLSRSVNALGTVSYRPVSTSLQSKTPKTVLCSYDPSNQHTG